MIVLHGMVLTILVQEHILGLGTNAAGCDSTATLNLTINNSNSSITNVTECDSYTWNGVTYTISGVYDTILTNMAGCDSTVLPLNLTINNSNSSITNVTECNSYTWNGTTYTVSGVYDTVLTNVTGCDSTAYLKLNDQLFQLINNNYYRM